MLEAAEVDIEFDRGRFQIAGTDKQVSIQDVAKAAFTPTAVPPGTEIGLYENATYTPVHLHGSLGGTFAKRFLQGCSSREMESHKKAALFSEIFFF